MVVGYHHFRKPPKKLESWWTSIRTSMMMSFFLDHPQRVVNGWGGAGSWHDWALETNNSITQLGAFNFFREFHTFQLTIFRKNLKHSPVWWKLKDRSEAKLSLRHRKDATPWGRVGCGREIGGLPVEIWNRVYVCFPNLGRKVRSNTEEATNMKVLAFSFGQQQ